MKKIVFILMIMFGIIVTTYTYGLDTSNGVPIFTEVREDITKGEYRTYDLVILCYDSYNEGENLHFLSLIKNVYKSGKIKYYLEMEYDYFPINPEHYAELNFRSFKLKFNEGIIISYGYERKPFVITNDYLNMIKIKSSKLTGSVHKFKNANSIQFQCGNLKVPLEVDPDKIVAIKELMTDKYGF